MKSSKREASVKELIKEGTCDLGVLDDGKVVIQFGELVRQMTFTPEQAKQLGLGFIEMATRAESQSRLNGKIGTHNMKTRH